MTEFAATVRTFFVAVVLTFAVGAGFAALGSATRGDGVADVPVKVTVSHRLG